MQDLLANFYSQTFGACNSSFVQYFFFPPRNAFKGIAVIYAHGINVNQEKENFEFTYVNAYEYLCRLHNPKASTICC